jgi:glycine cleavage system regulatory protein
MPASVVLTVIAEDQTGIVEKIAERILAAGANWEESRMARLAGKFAGLLRVTVDVGRVDALAESLAALGADGLNIIVERSTEPQAASAVALRLDLVGNDRPGIVRDIARVLANRRVNIVELETGVSSAPMSGEALFRATAHIRLPANVPPDALRQELEALAGELMVDLTIGDASE